MDFFRYIAFGKLGNTAAAAKAFKRTGFSVTYRAKGRKPDMSQFTGRIAGAFVKLTVQDQTCTQTCTKGHKYHILRTATGTHPPLCQRTCIGIVAEESGQSGSSLEVLHNRYPIPADQVGRRQHKAFFGAQRAAAADADGLGCFLTFGNTELYIFQKLRQYQIRGTLFRQSFLTLMQNPDIALSISAA